MENSKTRAIEAIRENTVEGPVRARSISAIAQVDTTGKPFKLFLEGSRRQGDAVLKTLKTAGIIETVRIAKPGQKALYTIAEEYREDPIVTEIVEEEEEFDSGHLTHMWIVEQVYDQLDEIEAGWEVPTRMKVAQLKARSILHNGEVEGKLGEAIDSILWTIAIYDDGVTVEDFPMEGPTGVSYSDRTLKTALGLLKSAGVLEVVGGGRSLRRYRAA